MKKFSSLLIYISTIFKVRTMFNNKTYRIDDVDFRLNPTSILERTNGETMTYLEYYQKVFEKKIDCSFINEKKHSNNQIISDNTYM